MMVIFGIFSDGMSESSQCRLKVVYLDGVCSGSVNCISVSWTVDVVIVDEVLRSQRSRSIREL